MKSGWIGVDLDGTLANYGGWQGPDHIGAPIMPMVERVQEWLYQGQTVKIFTARVAATLRQTDAGNSDSVEFAEQQIKLIQAWCLKYIGQALEVTATKDFGMIALYDDRAVQVEMNTGKIISNIL